MIDQALILAAGHGSRLRDHVQVPHKALVEIEGESLLSRTCRMLEQSGLREIVVVTGHRSAELRAALESVPGLGVELHFVENAHWELSNGLSVLAAAEVLQQRYLLMMADHLFDPAMVARMRDVELADDEVILAVDRKLDAIYDMDDATKVQVEGKVPRIVDIGKEIAQFNAVDTGLFACSGRLVECLYEVKIARGDCSLTDGMKVLLRDATFRAFDIGAAWWQDVDTPGALEHGARLFRTYGAG